MKCPLCSAGEIAAYLSTRDTRHYWICAQCDLIWLEEAQRPSLAQEESRYRTHKNYGADYLNYLGKTALPIAALLVPGANGVDYGCGPTQGMKDILSPMEFSLDSYDPIFFPKTELLKNHYEFLICSEAAEHFFYPGEEFARMDSLVKRGGVIAISSKLAVRREDFETWPYRRDPTHVIFFQEKTVHWIAQKFAWQILKLESPLWLFTKK